MDIFGEQLLKKKSDTMDWLKRGMIVFGGIAIASILMAISFATGFMVLTFFAVGALFGAVWLLGNTSYEYEYIITNEDLDIDKIVGKRTRKRLITVKMNTVEAFGMYDGTQGEGCDATVIATDGTNVNSCYVIAKHKKHGKTMVIFSPDQRMVQLILNTLPYKIKLEAKAQFRNTDTDTDEETKSESEE